MSFKSLFSLGFCLISAVYFARAEFVSVSQPYQDYVFDEVISIPEDRSLNFLNVQLPENKPNLETLVQIKPIYIPVATNGPLPTLSYQPAVNQLQSPEFYRPAYLHQNPSPNTNTNGFHDDNTILPSYPWLFAPSKTSPMEYPNYLAPPPLISFTKNPTQQPLQSSPGQFNYTQTLAKLLPKLLKTSPFLHDGLRPYSDLRLHNDDEKFRKNFESLHGYEPFQKISKIDVKHDRTTPFIAILPDETPSTSDQKHPSIKQATQADTSILLQNALANLNSPKRVQERIGAVYLRDLLLNRK